MIGAKIFVTSLIVANSSVSALRSKNEFNGQFNMQRLKLEEIQSNNRRTGEYYKYYEDEEGNDQYYYGGEAEEVQQYYYAYNDTNMDKGAVQEYGYNNETEAEAYYDIEGNNTDDGSEYYDAEGSSEIYYDNSSEASNNGTFINSWDFDTAKEKFNYAVEEYQLIHITVFLIVFGSLLTVCYVPKKRSVTNEELKEGLVTNENTEEGAVLV